MIDLLSPAICSFEEILLSPTAPASAKTKAAFEIIHLNGVEAIDPRGTDKTELHEFLRNSGVNIEQMNITLPPEYLEKGVAEIVEGQVREISSKPLVLIENSAAE